MNKKLLIWTFVMVLLVGVVHATCTGFSGSGAGTAENPYNVTSCIQLQQMGNNTDCLNDYYQLVNYINCSATSGWSSGAGFNPIGNTSNKFTGNFDGQGYNISDLFINRPSSYYIGLFGFPSNAEIENVGLIDVNITGDFYVGGLVGWAEGANTLINNTFVEGGSVHSNTAYSGGLVGQFGNTAGTGGDIYNSYSTATVTGAISVGGLVGGNMGSIYDSYATGNATGTGVHVGGLTGFNYDGVIVDCYATGDVVGSTQYVGGLVGRNRILFAYSPINYSYATGNVNGGTYVGGLVGQNEGNISASFSLGNVTGSSNFGSLIGQQTSGSLTNLYWYNSSGNYDECYNGGDTGCTLVNDSDYFKNVSNSPMDSWATTNGWAVNPYLNDGYPYLDWQTFEVYVINDLFDDTGLLLLDYYSSILNEGNSTMVPVVKIADLFTNPLVEFFINSSINISNVSVAKTASTSFVSDIENAPGVTGTHALYVPIVGNTGVYICPNATTIDEVNMRCSNKVSLSVGQNYSGMSLSIDGDFYKVSGLTGTGVGINGTPGDIPMEDDWNSSVDPFYTTDRNPVTTADNTCLENMKQGDTCRLGWNVVADWNETSTWTMFGYTSAETYPNNVSYNVTVYGNVTIDVDIPPAASNLTVIECMNTSTWINCTDLAYGDYLTRIRADCSGSENALFQFYNVQDDNYLLSGSYSFKDSSYYYYNYEGEILDSGNFTMNVTCYDQYNQPTSLEDEWWIPFGTLSVTSPNTHQNISRYSTFEYEATVTCVGGECGNVNATLDPIRT